MKKKRPAARRRSYPVTRDLSAFGGALLVVRDGVAIFERITRWERTVYPNGDSVVVMELA